MKLHTKRNVSVVAANPGGRADGSGGSRDPRAPVAERVGLAQAIWDSVSAPPEPFPLSEEEREKIDRCL